MQERKLQGKLRILPQFCMMYNPMYVDCIIKVYEATNDVEELQENLDLYMNLNLELVKDYRLCTILERHSMSTEDIDKILMMIDSDDLTNNVKFVKDAVDMYFAIEEESELIDSLKFKGLFPSLK